MMQIHNVIKDALFMLGGSLIAAVFMGFAMLKAYEEFLKGVKQNKRLHIWAAFFIISFLFIFFGSMVIRLGK